MRKQTIKSDKKQAITLLKALMKAKIPFRYSISSRTIVVEYEGAKEKFMESEMSDYTFIAFNKIRRDLAKLRKGIPHVLPSDVRYFQHNIRQGIKLDKAYYIDIKSAYANILYHQHFITSDTYKYIMALDKKDRLACVGMLAARKDWFSVDENGFIEDEGEERGEFYQLFFHAAKETFQIMDMCKIIMKEENQVFNWVDCVYFKEYTDEVRDVMRYLESENLQYHFNVIRRLSVVIFKNNVRIRFYEDDKLKVFNLPIQKRKGDKTRVFMNSRREKTDTLNNHYKKHYNKEK